jgi:Curli production assembly/transport component CsgG
MYRFLTIGLAALMGGCAQTSTGQGGSMASGGASVDGSASPQAARVTKCSAPLGTVALVEEQIPALAQAGLSSPIPVLRLLISQSGCFNVVDRGQALTRIQEEQALTGTGGSKKKLVAAQYFLTPNILFEDENAGGAGAAVGALASMLPGALGLIGSGVGYQASEAQALLFLTQTSTGLQIATSEGSAQTQDWTFAGLGGGGGFGGALGAYASTDIGKTVVAALIDAYNKMVAEVKTTQS